MTGERPMSRDIPKPYLIQKEDDGRYRLTLREVRYNSQNYPLITTTAVGETFKSANAARAHAREHFGAEAGQFATK